MKKSIISKFFDGLFDKIICCFLSKKRVSKLKFNERNANDFLTSLQSYFWRQSHIFTLMLGVVLTMGYTANSQNIKGIVPVQYPKSGSGVDGDAWAHEPIGTNFVNIGDLFDLTHTDINGHGLIDVTPGPSAGNVFYKPSAPQNPPVAQSVPVTYQIKDNYTGDFTIFTASNKINDNPKTYTWGAGSSPNKNEIQNCGVHFSYGDPNIYGGVTDASGNFISPTPAPGIKGVATDLWCLFAGDRQTINGSSYIDFEFLQESLTITGATFGPVDPKTGVAAINGGSGTFLTGAPDSTGGRTVGDVLITIEFTQGGGEATVVIRTWQQVGAGFEYVVVPNTSFPGSIFCTNNNVTTTVPFDVYGTDPGTYLPNQWAEGAINLTQVFRFFEKPCFNISSLFIRTRSSGSSSQSELKDFPGAPIQLNLSFQPDAPVTVSASRCGSGVVELSASGCADGTLKWFDAAVDGNQVATGTSFSPNIFQTTSYWVSCTSVTGCEGPRTQVTGTVITVNPGTIAGSQTLCTPFNPAAFTSTTPGTGNGTITYQWQMSINGCEGTWSDIVGATSETYDAPAVAVVTNFRRVATSTLNGVACPANSNCLTVTPNAINPGTIAGSQTLCTPFDPDTFTSSTPGSGGGAITYQWQISTTSNSAGFTDIVGATAATYNAPAVVVITWYRRVATSTLNAVPCSDNSNVLVVTPNSIAPGTVTGNQNICSGGNPAVFASTTPGSTTGGGAISYQWQSGLGTCATATFTNIVGATSATYDVPDGLAATTSYQRIATSTLNGVSCSATSNCITVTVINVNPGTIAGNQTICSGDNPAAFTETVPASGSNLTYQWQRGIGTCATATFTNIPGATSVTYDPPIGLTVTTSYRRVVNSTDADCPAISNCLTVTVNDISPGSIAGNQTLCSPFDPAAFTSVIATGSGVITYQWQVSTTGCTGTWSNIGGANLATYDAPIVSVVTNFRRVATSTLNGVPCSANSNCLTVTPNAVNPGEITGSQTLCAPFDPTAFTSTAPGSGNGVVTYQWQMSTTGCEGTWSNIPGTTSDTFDAAAVSVITNFRRVTTSTLNDAPCSVNSNCLTVTPNAVNPGSISGDQKVCIGDDVAAFTSTTPGSGSGIITYQWQSNTAGCGAAFSNIEGATLATYDPGVATVTTYYRRVTTSTVNGVPCYDYSNCLTVTAESCAKALCTYTQGYYGNPGGMSCAPDLDGGFDKFTTLALIERALASYGGTMTIGLTGFSVIITNTLTDRNAVIDVLPGGGSSYVLSSGNFPISALPNSYLKNGRINNTLLAQTITLGLNIGINGALGDFKLQGGILVTAAPEGGCGSDISKVRQCIYDQFGNLVNVINDYQYHSISASVVAAIEGEKTVQGLFELANKALGGGTVSASLTEIASAVDKINNAFDGCRIFIGYDVPRCPATTLLNTSIEASKTELVGFDAYPVPFKDQLTVKYNFDYASDVKIDVIDAQGVSILSKTDNNSYLNKEVTLNLNTKKGQEQVYIVKLTTNRGSSVKKVMSSK
ncbi:T9SS type A sorting domain-containing protein [Flavobacterium sp. XS2P39]|uniref:Ig-like domain-containing protein n=1 Tax=Flavobacterium sp. XS2P39 TaxID=3401725 RepID=UPI003AAAFD72